MKRISEKCYRCGNTIDKSACGNTFSKILVEDDSKNTKVERRRYHLCDFCTWKLERYFLKGMVDPQQET